MLKKLKDYLGIEGVKISLYLDDLLQLEQGLITGRIQLTSLREQEIEFILLRLVERYKRGRGEDKLIDEYELGQVLLTEKIILNEGGEKNIKFELPFVENLSEMDQMERSGFFNRAWVRLAKKIKGVQSSYRLEAKDKVNGTTLSPVASREVIFDT